MKEITVQELKEKLDNQEDIQVIDVREPYEFDIVNIGAELIPMAEINGSIDKVSRDKQVIVHCRSGARSAAVIESLERNHGYSNLYNLKGGILAYADQVDQSLPKY